jgi:hypothetical protein
MCSVTLDLLARTVMIRVFNYWTETDCDAVGRAINNMLDAFYSLSCKPWLSARPA